VEKWKKLLSLQTREVKQVLLDTIREIEEGAWFGMDVKKIKGFKNLYRLRKGKFRILFMRAKDGYVVVDLKIRNEETYK
jgi:mRNA-degrading endonuclease RelE of RelBE toxin-antitoxin system